MANHGNLTLRCFCGWVAFFIPFLSQDERGRCPPGRCQWLLQFYFSGIRMNSRVGIVLSGGASCPPGITLQASACCELLPPSWGEACSSVASLPCRRPLCLQSATRCSSTCSCSVRADGGVPRCNTQNLISRRGKHFCQAPCELPNGAKTLTGLVCPSARSVSLVSPSLACFFQAGV